MRSKTSLGKCLGNGLGRGLGKGLGIRSFLIPARACVRAGVRNRHLKSRPEKRKLRFFQKRVLKI